MVSDFMLEEPQDGWDYFEKILLKELIISMYRSIKDPTDRFIFLAIHESGYSQDEIASILNISQVAVSKRLKKTIRILREVHTEQL